MSHHVTSLTAYHCAGASFKEVCVLFDYILAFLLNFCDLFSFHFSYIKSKFNLCLFIYLYFLSFVLDEKNVILRRRIDDADSCSMVGYVTFDSRYRFKYLLATSFSFRDIDWRVVQFKAKWHAAVKTSDLRKIVLFLYKLHCFVRRRVYIYIVEQFRIQPSSSNSIHRVGKQKFALLSSQLQFY